MDDKELEVLDGFYAARSQVYHYVERKMNEKKQHLIEADKCQKLAQLAVDELNERYPFSDK